MFTSTTFNFLLKRITALLCVVLTMHIDILHAQSYVIDAKGTLQEAKGLDINAEYNRVNQEFNADCQSNECKALRDIANNTKGKTGAALAAQADVISATNGTASDAFRAAKEATTTREQYDLTNEEGINVAREVKMNLDQFKASQNIQCEDKTVQKTILKQKTMTVNRQCSRRIEPTDRCTLTHEIGTATEYIPASGSDVKWPFTNENRDDSPGVLDWMHESFRVSMNCGTSEYPNRRYAYITQNKTYWQREGAVDIQAFGSAGYDATTGILSLDATPDCAPRAIEISAFYSNEHLLSEFTFLDFDIRCNPANNRIAFRESAKIATANNHVLSIANRANIFPQMPSLVSGSTGANMYGFGGYWGWVGPSSYVNTLPELTGSTNHVAFRIKVMPEGTPPQYADRWYPQSCIDKVKSWMQTPACVSTTQQVYTFQPGSNGVYVGANRALDFGAFVDAVTGPSKQTGCVHDAASNKDVCANTEYHSRVLAPPISQFDKMWTSATFVRPACHSDTMPPDCGDDIKTGKCAIKSKVCMETSPTGECTLEELDVDCSEPYQYEITSESTTRTCAGEMSCISGECEDGAAEETNDQFVQWVSMANFASEMSYAANYTQENTIIFAGKKAKCEIYNGITEKNDCCTAPKGFNFTDFLQGVAGFKRLRELHKIANLPAGNPVSRQIFGGLQDVSSAVDNPLSAGESYIDRGITAAGDWLDSTFADLTGGMFENGSSSMVGQAVNSVTDTVKEYAAKAQGIMNSIIGTLYDKVANALGSDVASMIIQKTTVNVVADQATKTTVETITDEATGQVVKNTYDQTAGKVTTQVIEDGVVKKETTKQIGSSAIPADTGGKSLTQFNLGSTMQGLMTAYAVYSMVHMAESMFATCDKGDMETPFKVESRSTHYLGSYDSALGWKARSYCAFENPLYRIIMQQAHIQLNIPWGSPKNPDCSGLTIAQLNKMNFNDPGFVKALEEYTSIMLAAGILPKDNDNLLEKLTGKDSTLSSDDDPRTNAFDRNLKRFKQNPKANLDMIQQAMVQRIIEGRPVSSDATQTETPAPTTP